jgi:prolyl oligopeptidase
MLLDRRTLLATSALAGAAALLPGPARAAPPAARRDPTVETRFGHRLPDPYQWMENPKDRGWEPWMKAQAAHSRQWFDALPGRDSLYARISELSGDLAAVGEVQRQAGRTFIQKRPVGANVFKLYEVTATAERLLLDPEAMRAEGRPHRSIDYWSVSPDARHLVYGMSEAGSENSTIRIRALDTLTDLPESIPNAQYGSPSWLPDGSGFFHLRRRPGAVLGAPDYYAFSENWLHRLGTDPKTDRRIFPAPGAPAARDIDFPVVIAAPGSPHALLLMVGGVERAYALHIAPLADAAAGTARWAKVCDPADKVTDVTLRGSDLVLLSEKEDPLGRLLMLSGPDSFAIAAAREILPSGKLPLERAFFTADGLYVQQMNGGAQQFAAVENGRAIPVPMPFATGVLGLFADPTLSGFDALVGGWLEIPAVWRFEPGKPPARAAFSPRAPFDTIDFEAISTLVPVRDRTRVPVTIVARRGLARDGRAPLWADAYGAYQIPASPGLSPRELAFLERGGVTATIGVRGGGEFGRPWWEAGKKETKANSWQDFIDVTEWLIRERWTSADRLTIVGTSAGGITVGRALTERPQQFGLAVARVPVLNPTRGEQEQNNAPNVPEFGDPMNEGDFPHLLAMDSYRAVRPGTRYPMVILTTGMTDPRVAPWHAAKMAAALQHATASGKPILLRVDFDAGHGLGSTRAQADAEFADLFAAALSLAG